MVSVIDGVTVTYQLARNVSRNRANPHRLTATCVCGVEFLRVGCSNRVDRYLAGWLREQLRRHRTSGYCGLTAAPRPE